MKKVYDLGPNPELMPLAADRGQPSHSGARGQIHGHPQRHRRGHMGSGER